MKTMIYSKSPVVSFAKELRGIDAEKTETYFMKHTIGIVHPKI